MWLDAFLIAGGVILLHVIILVPVRIWIHRVEKREKDENKKKQDDVSKSSSQSKP